MKKQLCLVTKNCVGLKPHTSVRNFLNKNSRLSDENKASPFRMENIPKQRIFVTLFLIFSMLSAMLVCAEPVKIILAGPSDNDKVTDSKVTFIFNFDQYASINNCSVIIDDEPRGTLNTLIGINGNKISVNLNDGTYDWFIRCYDAQLNQINSSTRTLTVNTASTSKGGYQNLTYTDGTMAFILSPYQGQTPISLPGAKAGDEIQLKIKGKTYYLFIIRVGVSNNGTFSEVKDKNAGKIHKLLTTESADFDFDGDNITDIKLTLDHVVRDKNAYFIVTPYPDSLAEEEIPVEEPAEEEPPATEEAPAAGTTEKEKTGMTILIVLVVIIILLIIILIIARKKKEKPVIPNKTAEKRAPDAPEKEEAPSDDVKFDIIKSDTKRVKK